MKIINMKNSKIIYSINIKDVQDVSTGLIGRKLSNSELEIVERELGDYISWDQAIELVISEKLKVPIPEE